MALFLHAIRAPSIATNTRHETLILYEKNVESLKYFAAAIENAILKTHKPPLGSRLYRWIASFTQSIATNLKHEKQNYSQKREKLKYSVSAIESTNLKNPQSGTWI
jgi:hypothetical protein